MLAKTHTAHEVVTRRCSLQRHRFRWTIAAPDGVRYQHSLISFPTEADALRHGRNVARELDESLRYGVKSAINVLASM